MSKIAAITGSTSGIGLGIAEKLASLVHRIMINGFASGEEIAAIKEKLLGLGAKAVEYFAADLSRPEECAALIAATNTEFGGLDILINNAGVQHVAPITKFSNEEWQKVINLNLSAAFYTMKSAVEIMQTKKWGRIINIASTHGLVASAQKPAYVAAKHGVIGLTKSVAVELANSGITVNAICPGWVLTPLVEKQIEVIAERESISYEQAKVKLLSEKQPMHKFNTPSNIGAMVAFLVSDAAEATTGAAMVMDGGWVAQ